MQKTILLILLLFLCLYNVETKAFQAKKIDLKIKEDETTIVFINLKNSKSLLINDEDDSNLFILEYKNDKKIKETLNIFDSKPNVFYLNNHYNKKVGNIYIFNQNEVLKFRINNYTLCIYNKNKTLNNCDFVYIMDIDKEFKVNENLSAIFYDENIKTSYLANVEESWIDNSIVSQDSFTILKLNEDSYNIVIIPSTND